MRGLCRKEPQISHRIPAAAYTHTHTFPDAMTLHCPENESGILFRVDIISKPRDGKTQYFNMTVCAMKII